jgi:opacity protein-like surface antigen
MRYLLTLALSLSLMTNAFGHEESHTHEITHDHKPTPEAEPVWKLPKRTKPYGGWYLGGGLSYTEFYSDEGPNDFDTEDDDTGIVMNAGYRFNEFVALELGYLDAGNFSLETDQHGNNNRIKSDISIKAIQSSFVLYLPIPKHLEVYGKLGAAFYEGESDQRLLTWDGTVINTESNSESGVDFLIGLGAGFSFADNWHIRVEWQDFFVSDDFVPPDDNQDGYDFDDWEESGVTSLSLELHYRFGDNWKWE